MSAKRRGKGQRSFGNREYSELYPGTTSVDAVDNEDYYESVNYSIYDSDLGQPAHGGYPSPTSTETTYGDWAHPSLRNADYSKRGIPRHVPKQGSRKHQKASPQGDEDFVIVGQLDAPQEPDSTGEEAKQPLGPEYSTVADPQTYFTRGRVFKTPWSMPAGPRTSPLDPHVTPSAFGQQAYTEMTRFVVWLAKPTHCLALAIHTYGGLGTNKFTLRPGDRSPVFDATKKWDKAQILRREIPIWVEDKRVSINYPHALVDFSQIFTVHFYAPILKIGYVPGWAWPAVEGCVRHSLNMISENDLSKILSDVANDSQRPRATGSEVAGESQGDHQLYQLGQASEYDKIPQWEPQTYSPPTQWACDWLGCPRSLNHFSRIDHYRDHLRDYHSEDILGKKRKDALWFEGRNIYPDWWRCSNCLSRVRIEESGLDCHVCSRPCEPERQKFRATRFPL